MEKMMELQEGTFDAASVQLHYTEGPKTGPPLVLLHGATGSRETWTHLLPGLTERWHVYLLDLRGHGQSGWGNRPEDYHLSRNVEDMVAFLEGQVRDKAVLVGHSWGGVIALLSGAPAKTQLRGLVLEDPPISIRRPNAENKPYLDYFAWVYHLKQTTNSIDEMRTAILAANPDGVPPEHLATWAKNLVAVDPNFLTAILAGTMPADGIDFERSIQGIACPILLLQADPAKNCALVQEDIDLVLKNAADVHLVHFPGAGHGIHDDQPAAFLKVLDYFQPGS
jgi:pimeloyl-ACP methyl ester carboxylesterase